jgi:uncharacterized protein YuzE
MTVKIGNHEFDWVSYDESGDVLYLSKGPPEEARDTMASPEGHAVRLDLAGEVIGLTLVNARWLLEKQGEITVTVPERLTARSDALAAALAG